MSLEELKAKIKEEIPISSIIGHYLSIKKSGSSLLSLCPFHSDSKPSLNINDHKKMFKCFSCDTAGDAIGFVMKFKNLDFIDALKEICQKQGINFDSFQEEKKNNPKLEMAKKLLSKTAILYRKMATSHQFIPYDEFIKKRGLNEEVASIYSLGFSPKKNTLCDYLKTIPDEKERNYAQLIALEIGLIKKDQNQIGAHYDTFRERIIFPIWDQSGQVLGFTSRSIELNPRAKYMNSIDSFIFNKKNILYGLHLAKNAIREQDAVFLVEGNMDQIALYHHGFHHTVAVMGVALGEHSLERLIQLTKNIYLGLDSDQAGFKAMERINRQLAEKGIVAKFLDFAPHKDPDEFLSQEGKIHFQKKVEQAVPFFDVLLDKMTPDKLPEVLDKKLHLLNLCFELLSPLGMQLAATERVIGFSKRLGLKATIDQILKIYQEFLEKISEKEKQVSRFQNKITPLGPLNPLIFKKDNIDSTDILDLKKIEEKVKSSFFRSEKLVLQELIQLPSLFTEEKILELLDLVTSDEVKKYIEKVRKVILEIDESEYPAVISNLTSSEEYSLELKEAVASALFKYKIRVLDLKTKRKILSDLKTKLQMELLKNQKNDIKKRQETIDTEEEMNLFLQSLSKVETHLQTLKKAKKENQNAI